MTIHGGARKCSGNKLNLGIPWEISGKNPVETREDF